MTAPSETDAQRIEIPGDGRPGLSSQDEGRSRQPLALAIGALIVALIAVGSFLALSSGTYTETAGNSEELPVIRADTRPFKVSPDEPGGLDVPNRDKLVYSRLKGVAETPEVERLLPEPEAPLPLPTAPTATAPTATAPALTAPAATETAATEPPASEPKVTPPAATAAQTAAVEPPDASSPTAAMPPPDASTPEVAAAPPPAAAVAPVPMPRPAVRADAGLRTQAKPELTIASLIEQGDAVPSAATTKVSTGGPVFLVQLGAMSSPDAANAQWQKVMSSNRDLLGGLKPKIAEADIGEKRLYRLRAGPIDAPEKAQALCKALSGRSVGCVVVSTGG